MCTTAAFLLPAKALSICFSELLLVHAMALAHVVQTVKDQRGALAIGLAGAGASLLAIRLLLRSKVDRFREVPGSWLVGVLPQLGPGAKFITEKIEEGSLLAPRRMSSLFTIHVDHGLGVE